MMAKMRSIVVLSASVLIAPWPAIGQSAYEVEQLVPAGSPFHGVHGLRFDRDGRLYATSVIGQSIFKVDVDTGSVERVIGPPEGMGDDIAIAPDGTLVWTAIEDGIVYAKPPGGPIRKLMENMHGVNAVTFSPDGKRLFVTLVFYGDALYELDLDGEMPPRLIAQNMGGLNACQVGDDGMIYGPLMFAGRVVRIDPATGEITTVSDDFDSPGALKLDFEGAAFVLDGRWVKRVDLRSGRTSRVAELPSDGDNLALGPGGRLFVSLSAENAIAEIDVDSGDVGYAVDPAPLNSPAGLAVATTAERDRIYVGDLFGGLRAVDGNSGAITDTPLDLFQPTHVSVGPGGLIVVGEVFGDVQRVDPETFAVLEEWGDFAYPGDALEMADGTLIVAETGTGRLLHVTGTGAADRTAVAEDLAAPRGLARAGAGAVYLTEANGGRVLRVEIGSGATTVVAGGLRQPEGVAVTSDGGIVVAEVGAKRLVRIGPRDGAKTVIAADLPIGLTNGPSLYRGVAAGKSAIYYSSDIDNTIYKLTPR
jgi:DNA-binding beta-propeller fold protein YncE